MPRPAEGRAGRVILAATAAAALCSCGTYQAYEGPARPVDQVAIVRGDMPVNAGLPVQAILRSVDGRKLRATQSAVAVTPGTHRFLVDCWLAATAGAARFEVEETVEAGHEYRLKAEASARSCDAVSLIIRRP